MKNTAWARRLAEEVVKARSRQGYKTQESLAEKVGISTRLIGDIENGRRESYAKSTLQRLDNALSWEEGTAAAILSGEQLQPATGIDYSITQDIGGHQIKMGYLTQMPQPNQEPQWEVRVPVPAEELANLNDMEKAELVNSAVWAVRGCLNRTVQRPSSNVPPAPLWELAAKNPGYSIREQLEGEEANQP